MSGYADLEVGLHHRTERTWSVELRFTQPRSEAEDRFTSESADVRFDLARLKERVYDPDAYGRILTESLFVPDVKEMFGRARMLAQGGDQSLRIRLLIGPSAPELHGVRWETLRDPADGSALLRDENILFSRYLSSRDWRPVGLHPKSELRVLVAIANPSNLAEYEREGRRLPPIDVAMELERVTRAVKGIPATALASRGKATLTALIDQLREGHDILYLVCHGYHIHGESQILLEDPSGRVHRIPGADFIDALRDLQRPPRLVVLASCQSAGPGEEASSDDRGTLAALGPRMAEAGVPAVLAMQGRISMQTIERFVPVFFEELNRDGRIDRAMTQARRAVADRPDWWVPVLFTRLKSGRFWYTPGFTEERDFTRWYGLCNDIREGRCTPVLGPGMTDAFIGSRQEIARGWASRYHFPMAQHHSEDLPHVAQYLTVEQGPNLPRDEWRRYVTEELLKRHGEHLPDKARDATLEELISTVGAYRRSIDRAEPHAVLARMPFKIFITTDPTSLLTDALNDEGRDPQVELCRWNEEEIWPPSVFEDHDYKPTIQHPLVFHLYGRVDLPSTMVITEDDYFDYLIGVTRDKALMPAVVRRAFTDSALLFLGFRLDEWDFRILFRSIINQEGLWRNRRYPHVAVQIDPEEGRTIEPERARRYLRNYFSEMGRIRVSIYWGSAEDFMRDLDARWRETQQ